MSDTYLQELLEQAHNQQRLREAALARKARTKHANEARRTAGNVAFMGRLEQAMSNPSLMRSIFMRTRSTLRELERMYKVDKRQIVLDRLMLARYRHRWAQDAVRRFRRQVRP